MQDPYEVLGVAKSASAKDIKSAYRKLAKKHHPDQNPDDPKAKDRFAAVNQAYEIVGDEKNRAAFDRGEIDADGKPRFQGFEGAAGGGIRSPASAAPSRGRAARVSNSAPRRRAAIRSAATDIFSELFGAGFSQRPGWRCRQRPAPAGRRRQRDARCQRRGGGDGAKVTAIFPDGRKIVGQAAGLCRGWPDDPPEGPGRAGLRAASRATRWSRSGSAGIRATASRAATCMPTCRCRCRCGAGRQSRGRDADRQDGGQRARMVELGQGAAPEGPGPAGEGRRPWRPLCHVRVMLRHR